MFLIKKFKSRRKHPVSLLASIPSTSSAAAPSSISAAKKPTVPSLQLLDLPPEIHSAIVTYLAFPSKPNLKCTNHYFYDLVAPLTHNELLEAEQILPGVSKRFEAASGLSCSAKFFACKDCLRLRPRSKFANHVTRDMKRKRKRRGIGGMDADQRFCIDCGIKENRFYRGEYIEIGYEGFVLCVDCGEFRAKAKERGERRRCQDCWLSAHRVTLWREGRKQRRKARVEQRELHYARVRRKADRDLYDRTNYHAFADLEWLNCQETGTSAEPCIDLLVSRGFNDERVQ